MRYSIFQGCYAAQIGSQLTMFCDNLSVPSSRIKQSDPCRLTGCPETLVTNHPTIYDAKHPKRVKISVTPQQKSETTPIKGYVKEIMVKEL
jgi:hypothetical protein